MNNLNKILLVTFLMLSVAGVKAQDDLMDLLGDDSSIINYEFATFKTTRIINGQSIENPANGTLIFLIQHRFGKINDGWYELWGLDQSTIRFGFEYGVNDRLAIGYGRSSFEKTYDGFIKYKILRQCHGARNMPVSLSYFVSTAITSMKWEEPERSNYFSSRMSFVHQLLIARKFSPSISIQLTPSVIHKNLVPTTEDANTAFAMGFAGRGKISKRVSINAEYFYVPDGQYTEQYYNSFSLGFDIETGGHVFQLHATNSRAMFDRGFITETNGQWSNADIYFGFNISRVFTIKKPKEFRHE